MPVNAHELSGCAGSVPRLLLPLSLRCQFNTHNTLCYQDKTWLATPTSVASSGKTLLRGQHKTPGKRGPVLPVWARSSCPKVSPNGDGPPSEVQGNECRGELGTQFCVRSQVIPAPAMGHHLGPLVPRYKALEDREQLAGKRTPSPPSRGPARSCQQKIGLRPEPGAAGRGLGVTPPFMAQAAEMLTQTVLMVPSSSHGAPLHPSISCLSSDHPYMDDQGAGRWTSQIQGAGNRGVLAGWLKPMLALALEPEQRVGS